MRKNSGSVASFSIALSLFLCPEALTQNGAPSWKEMAPGMPVYYVRDLDASQISGNAPKKLAANLEVGCNPDLFLKIWVFGKLPYSADRAASQFDVEVKTVPFSVRNFTYSYVDSSPTVLLRLEKGAVVDLLREFASDPETTNVEVLATLGTSKIKASFKRDGFFEVVTEGIGFCALKYGL